MPYMARHFLYEILRYNCDNGIEIINATTRLSSDQVGEFLSLVAGYLDGYFHSLEAELDGYHNIKVEALTILKNSVDDVEELN